MRIDFIKASNFKSLVNFHLKLAGFTCLIGLNGSGKSTVLQLIDFLAQQVRGDVREWLKQRQWKPGDLCSKFAPGKNVDFLVQFGILNVWKCSFNTTRLQCTKEILQFGDVRLDVHRGIYRIREGSRRDPGRFDTVAFDYEGSILSQIKESMLPGPLVDFKRFLQGVSSLDMLSPYRLRQRTRASEGMMGLGGQRLSAYLYEIGEEKRSELHRRLRQVYKQLDEIQSKSMRSGWKQLAIRETFGDRSFITEARHINDGMLRLLAIFAELDSQHTFLLLDEIENGISPELVEFVIKALTEARQQILVTTHSPMILNYLDDEIARQGVVYLYKTDEGATQAIPFFSIPSIREKLEVMGPGEAFVDTNLSQLADEIGGMTTGRP